MAKQENPAAVEQPKTPKVGATVNVVLANGKTAPAKVTAIDDADRGLLSVAVTLDSGTVDISGSPHDPDAKRPDSWNIAS